MGKILLSVFLSTTVVLSMTPSSTAQAASAETLITGYVLEAGAPLSGVTVIASCGRYFADADITDTTGSYLTSLPAAECGPLSDVELVAVFDTSFATARGITYKVTSKLNIASTTILMDSLDRHMNLLVSPGTYSPSPCCKGIVAQLSDNDVD